MTKEEFIKFLQSINATNEQIKQFEQYKKLVQIANQHENLTRLCDENKIYGQYFYNSIYPFTTLNWTNINNLLDVGSGSGIPGIALAILHPNQHLTIVEANTKKINFLSEVVKTLELAHVQLINERAESISEMYKNYFDLTTARAVAKIKVILELTIPYLKVNGTCLLLKGENWQQELKEAQEIMQALSVKLDHVLTYQEGNNVSYALFFTKTKLTSEKYPRKWTEIKK